MNEIKCPKCGNVFSVDEADYASIANQIRNNEFNEELARRTAEQEKRFTIKQELELNKKELEFRKILEKKEQEISRLGTEVARNDSLRKMAVLETENSFREKLQAKDTEIAELKGKMTSEKDAAIIREKSLADKYNSQLKEKQELIDYYKDLKTRMSTKMIGETLEIHCSTEFNRMRMSMYPRAYFEKDNDVRGGTKGDFVFRDYDEDGTEYISVMFEMKNEMDGTAVKHKNEDFFAKLDKDRNEKGCEYAVLVSLLEPDSELYNAGIVDVSYRFPKMYVIRPQFFMPIISLLTQAAKNSLGYRKALAIAQKQSVDVTNFEEHGTGQGFGSHGVQLQADTLLGFEFVFLTIVAVLMTTGEVAVLAIVKAHDPFALGLEINGVSSCSTRTKNETSSNQKCSKLSQDFPSLNISTIFGCLFGRINPQDGFDTNWGCCSG